MIPLKERFRSVVWSILGKYDKSPPNDYDFPICPYEALIEDLSSSFAIDLSDYQYRSRAVLAILRYRILTGGNPEYPCILAWRLVPKMVNAGEQDLARALDLELEHVWD